MPSRIVGVGRLGDGRGQRGVYEYHLNNFKAIPGGAMALIPSFQLGDFEWRVGVGRHIQPLCSSEAADEHRNEMVQLALFSDDSETVYSEIKFGIVDPKEAKWLSDERTSKVAAPFACMEVCSIDVRNLWDPNQRELSDTLVVRADFKNIRAATHEEQRSSKIGRRVKIQIIDKNSINKRLNKKRFFGIAPSATERNCTVYCTSHVHNFSTKDPNCRYLLCERLSDGNLIAKRCLNDAPLDETFGQIVKNDAHPTLTVLEEIKRSDETFQVVDDNSVFVFIKNFDPNFGDLSYLGFLQAKKTTKCQSLLGQIERQLMDDDDVTRGYNAYLETEMRNIEEITFNDSTVEEIGMYSGNCIIIRCKKTPSEELAVEEVLHGFQNSHVEDEGSECMQFDIVNCNAMEMSGHLEFTDDCVHHSVTSCDQAQASFLRLAKLLAISFAFGCTFELLRGRQAT